MAMPWIHSYNIVVVMMTVVFAWPAGGQEEYPRRVREPVDRVTWCGRFSIPFGLALAYYLNRNVKSPPLDAVLLRYGTTLDPGRSVPGVEGLGVTAPASLHHWVGFFAMGVR